MENLEKECSRLAKTADQLADCSDKEVIKALRPKQVIQSVKAISKFLGEVETTEIYDACSKLITTCLEFDKSKGNEEPSGKLRPEIVEEVGEKYATVVLKDFSHQKSKEHAQNIKNALGQIQRSVQGLIEIYAKSFRCNFSTMKLSDEKLRNVAPKELKEVKETLLTRICAIHRIPVDWQYDEFSVSLQVYHGTRPIADPLQTVFQSKRESFYEYILFDSWLESRMIKIISLPRESRLVLTLFGRKVVTEDKHQRLVTTELGWTALQLFNYDQFLVQGTFLLNIWPCEAEKQIGPAPDSSSHPDADTCPLISIGKIGRLFQFRIHNCITFDFTFRIA